MAIIIAGGAEWRDRFISTGSGENVAQNNLAVKDNAVETAKENNVKAVSSADHIRGNPNAQVKVIEFSDPECPFCKRFRHNE